MPLSIIQQRYVTSTNGNGTTHDLQFTAPAKAGSSLLAPLFCAEDVVSATINGISGNPAAWKDDEVALAVNTARPFRYQGPSEGATGFRFTTLTPHFDLSGWIIEVAELDSSPYIGMGRFPQDFQPVELDAIANVSRAGDGAFAVFSDVPLANITATRSGFTQSSESTGTVLLQYNLNSGATSVNAGASLSSNTLSTAGYVVTYRSKRVSPLLPSPDVDELLKAGAISNTELRNVNGWL